jgi:hypothetical protein
MKPPGKLTGAVHLSFPEISVKLPRQIRHLLKDPEFRLRLRLMGSMP